MNAAPPTDAYRACRHIARSHYENFPVASLLLPRRLRDPVAAIYAFAREADDLADEGELSPGERLARLDAHGAALEAAARGRPPRHPTFRALADVFDRYRLPVQPFRDLLTAFRQDVTRDRYPDFEELLTYCRHSANPVGRLLLGLFAVSDPVNRDLSDRVCTALQLLNFLQDIEPDLVERGRVYLPQADLRAHGVTEEELAEGGRGARVQAVIHLQAARTRRLLAEGAPLVGRVPLRLGLQLAATIEAAERLLNRLEYAPQAPRLRRRDAPAVLGRALWRLSRSRQRQRRARR